MARTVALLAEGVDRNTVRNVEGVDLAAVALLAEGVDRNSSRFAAFSPPLWSPSSRRAWIEIYFALYLEL